MKRAGCGQGEDFVFIHFNIITEVMPIENKQKKKDRITYNSA